MSLFLTSQRAKLSTEPPGIAEKKKESCVNLRYWFTNPCFINHALEFVIHAHSFVANLRAAAALFPLTPLFRSVGLKNKNKNIDSRLSYPSCYTLWMSEGVGHSHNQTSTQWYDKSVPYHTNSITHCPGTILSNSVLC